MKRINLPRIQGDGYRLCLGPSGPVIVGYERVEFDTIPTFTVGAAVQIEKMVAADTRFAYIDNPIGPLVRRELDTGNEFFYSDGLSLPALARICVSSLGHVLAISPEPNSLDFFLPNGQRLPGIWKGGEARYFDNPATGAPFWETGASCAYSFDNRFVVCGEEMGRVDVYAFDGRYEGSIQGREMARYLGLDEFTPDICCLAENGTVAVSDGRYVVLCHIDQGVIGQVDAQELHQAFPGSMLSYYLFFVGNDLYTIAPPSTRPGLLQIWP